MIVLGIETSCDETSAAVLEDGKVLSNIISSQLVHKEYGGIVPELASRAHMRLIVSVVEQALNAAGVKKMDLNGVASTYGPGLMGALLVGLNFGKSLAYGLNIPFVGINHIEAHMYSNFIDEPQPGYPFVCLTVSGGHTQLALIKEPLCYRLLGETLDDAAGEAFDKVGKMLGLGFPGGPYVDQLAKEGNPEFVRFPRAYLDADGYDFSFSGIKTAVLYWLRDNGYPAGEGKQADRKLLSDLCASFQAAVVEVLVEKTVRAVRNLGIGNVAVAGGVSANSELRSRLKISSDKYGYHLFIPDFQYCTDNGAMIAMLGWLKLKKGIKSDLFLTAVPNLTLDRH